MDGVRNTMNSGYEQVKSTFGNAAKRTEETGREVSDEAGKKAERMTEGRHSPRLQDTFEQVQDKAKEVFSSSPKSSDNKTNILGGMQEPSSPGIGREHKDSKGIDAVRGTSPNR